MDAQRWTAEQIRLREAMRLLRHPPEADSSVASVTEVPPLASVIVVCWNSADVLDRCLRQLLAQDYPNYEIIVVDDGSRDRTRKVAERALSSGKLTIVGSPVNRGCPHARNLGLCHARGEIVAFIDADGFAAPSWVRHLVATFAADESIGGVASTVFFAANPVVINGAGGTVNRQGWSADLAMNQAYDRAEIPSEVLYPMGCGMAMRRSAVERVGPFDDRMLNYYDDVDYGMRLWRAGYRVVVAPDAWIDHDFGHSRGNPARKELLCEQHRMRVVLKHASLPRLTRWALHEALATIRAALPRRHLKLKAMRWNVRHLPSTVGSRWRLRRSGRVPDRLVHPSWGDGFPSGVPPLRTPCPETATNVIDMADPRCDGQLLYGWFAVESIRGCSYRWADIQAAALIRLDMPARRLRLHYAHVPADIGGVDMYIRRLGLSEPLTPVWATHLLWQSNEQSVENHLLELPAGDYEVVFCAHQGWSDPRVDTRLLGFALARMSFDESYEIASGGVDMVSPRVVEQLMSGWFGAEYCEGRNFRWSGGHATVMVRVAEPTRGIRLSYRLPPRTIGGLKISVRPMNSRTPVWSTRIAWKDQDWHDDRFPLRLVADDYAVTFDAERTWSNPDQRDPAFSADNRSFGFALSSLSFEGEA